jgi:hypothetical protein
LTSYSFLNHDSSNNFAFGVFIQRLYHTQMNLPLYGVLY